MLFNSLDFLVFFVSVFVIYWIIPSRAKWIILLVCSYFFYAYWNPLYIFLLFASTLIDYVFGLYFTSSNNSWKQRVGLIVSLSLNLGMLFSFKYYNFFADGINALFTGLFNHKVIPNFSILLPVGISFYTFQSISYAIDVYKKRIPAERNLGKFALFISFFPQLVAGPIERAKDLLPQIHIEKKVLTLNFLIEGLKYILWGLFLKVVVADNLATMVDAKFDNYFSETGGGLVFGIILFAFQLYCDFNGYSKMAIGLAALLGYRLQNNFNYPFISASFNEFWRRWHISFTDWVRDYLFIPLGGTRCSKIRASLNIFLTFSLVGLWHGASINYLFWGILSGVYILTEYWVSPILKIKIKFVNHLSHYIKIGIVFFFFCISIVPIRAINIDVTLMVYSKIFYSKIGEIYFWFADNRYAPGMLGLYVVIFIEIWFGLKLNDIFNLKTKFTEPLFYSVIFFMILLLGKDTGSQFIYFQF